MCWRLKVGSLIVEESGVRVGSREGVLGRNRRDASLSEIWSVENCRKRKATRAATYLERKAVGGGRRKRAGGAEWSPYIPLPGGCAGWPTKIAITRDARRHQHGSLYWRLPDRDPVQESLKAKYREALLRTWVFPRVSPLPSLPPNTGTRPPSTATRRTPRLTIRRSSSTTTLRTPRLTKGRGLPGSSWSRYPRS